MQYSFYCESCGNEESINIPIEEYFEKRDQQKCSKCGKPLKRKFEFSGSISGHGEGWFGTGKGGWNS